MAAFLNEASDNFDIVLIDSPPVIAVTDATLLATRVDGVILVIKSGVTRIDMINNAIDQLKKANEKFLGVVLNQVKITPGDYNYYYYYGSSKHKSAHM
jgi:Mrp family chromosome partitioning ATPase